jgi:Protein of unknown function (DUF3047)
MQTWWVVAFGLWVAGCASTPEPPARAVLPDWHELALPGKQRTLYTGVLEQGRTVVRAESKASASMLRRWVRVEPASLGTIRFSWRVPALIGAADLTDRHASDSPVRLILAFDGDHARLPARNRLQFELAQAVSGEAPPYATLMYVWDNKAPAESVIHSGRTDRIRKIVLESGSAKLGTWCHYERDVAADFRRSFGEDPGALIAVGLMTDSDNTKSSARAWYGEVRFIAPDGRIIF